jgi:predicted metal-binding membrane protein
MGYRFAVSEFADQRTLTSLSPVEARLSAVLAQPKRIALGCVVALAGLGWLALGLMSAQMPSAWQMLCQPGGAGRLSELAPAAAMWTAMVLAMMLPTVGPMILTYAEIADTAARKGEPVVSPMVLSAGYAVVWLGFALVAATGQWILTRAGLPLGGNAAQLAAGTVFLGAGLYQFSGLKQACLAVCQRPFPFFFSNWTTEPSGVFGLGLRQGMLCLGCCWAMMGLMFITGAMNVVWMAVLGVLMTMEKLATTPRFSEIVGIVFGAIGFMLVVSSVLSPWT